MANILVAGGFLTTALLYREVLQDEGHRVLLAMNGEEGQEFVERGQIDLVIVDGNLSDFEVSEFLRKLKLLQPHLLGVLCVWDSHGVSVDRNLWDGFYLKTKNYTSLQTVIQKLSSDVIQLEVEA